MYLDLELLAPARDAEVARHAILHGADAIYMGGPSHGARAAAGNSIADIAEVVQMAHAYGVRVYVALNTIIYDTELSAVERLVWDYWRIGVDALIVQDMGLLRMHLPPIALHASTQCDIRDAAKARFLAECGFSQLVLARELSLSEIKEIREAVPPQVQLEAFVHGALCVSYSGDCQASYCANGRSANRGECAQMCRMAYDLVDGEGNVLVRGKHLLSLRDLCRISDLDLLVAAGVTSFKIEGRLKDAAYVKNAVAAYRAALDKIIAESGGKYRRSSWGRSRIGFTPDVTKAFNRGFTPYFLDGRPAKPVRMANFDTPKWVGEKVGKVRSVQGRKIVADLDQVISNGDGLGYFAKGAQYDGFRVNRAEGAVLYAASDISCKPGDALYRNRDTARDQQLESPATRKISVKMTLRAMPWGIALRIEGEDGAMAEAAAECKIDAARSSQTQPRERTLSKLGDTVYELSALDDLLGEYDFVPASVLADLRRRAVDAFGSALRATYHYDYRRSEDLEVALPQGTALTYHDNVANSLAREFYSDHGAQSIGTALEAEGMMGDGASIANGKADVVMTTRYCLRRELGACLRKPGAKRLPADLYLQNKAARWRLSFDCARCQMQLHC